MSFKTARTGLAAILMASAMSLSGALAAQGPAAPAPGVGSGPLAAAFHLATELKAAATLVLDPASLWDALNRRVAAAGEEAGRQRLAAAALADTAATTGSITAGTRAREAGKPPAARKPGNELLASVAIPFGRLPAMARMQPVYADMKAGLFEGCSNAACGNARATLATVVEKGRDGRFLALIGAVNRSVNRLIAYRRDRDVHGVVDSWSTPSQTLASGTGDCEDYAILKMAVLAEAGVPEKSMSLVVLRDESRGVYHAVLAIRTSDGSFILDNLHQSVRRDSELPAYVPLYSVSAGRGYIYGRRTGAGALSASAAGFDAIAPGEGLDGSWREALPVVGMRGPL